MYFMPFLLLPVMARSCNHACQARQAEAQFLRPGLVERHGAELIIVTAGKRQAFTDRSCDTGEAQTCALYAVIANVPASHAVVVQKFEYEGSDCFLVDTRTGRKTLLTGTPVFSPDGHELLITRMSNETDNNLEIWRRQGDTVRLEWAHPFKLAYVEDPTLREMYEARVTSWTGGHIALALTSSDEKKHWAGELTRTATGWHLSAKSPPGLLP